MAGGLGVTRASFYDARVTCLWPLLALESTSGRASVLRVAAGQRPAPDSCPPRRRPLRRGCVRTTLVRRRSVFPTPGARAHPLGRRERVAIGCSPSGSCGELHRHASGDARTGGRRGQDGPWQPGNEVW